MIRPFSRRSLVSIAFSFTLAMLAAACGGNQPAIVEGSTPAATATAAISPTLSPNRNIRANGNPSTGEYAGTDTGTYTG